MPRGRQRAEDRLEEIALRAAQGRALRAIARELGFSYRQVATRFRTIRTQLVEVTGDPVWLSSEGKTVVECARRWCGEHDVELPEP